MFYIQTEFIKDKGTYEEKVNKYPEYKKSFIVTDNPITDLQFVSSLRK